jgi:Transposase DDE domain
MYIERVPNRNSRPALLLREAWREGKTVRKRTVANLTDWPAAKVEALRRVLRGEGLAAPETVFTVERALPHGHVEALLGTIRRLGLDTLLAAKRCRERDLVLALLVERLLHPCSKLATTRLWATTTLAEELAVGDATADEVYAAMDWLEARQTRIEQKLAHRHLGDGARVFYDVSSSFYEGHTCPLAQFGHDRDGKHGLPVIVYGVLTDAAGRPVAIEVYPGNTGDPTTVPAQVETLRGRFGLSRVVLVGDRGMLTETQLDTLRQFPGVGWISALRGPAIRALVEQGSLQLSLFDTTHLAELTAPEYPGERLVACFNPLLADERRRKREALLAATEHAFQAIARDVARRRKTPLTAAEIGVKVGRVRNRFKVGKHFAFTIADGVFRWVRQEDAIRREAALDGLYVIRTSEPAAQLSAADTVRTYKTLAQVERVFRCLKGIDLRVRPIYHRIAPRVRAHFFLCLLAYYVEWHLRETLRPLLFEDEQLPQDRLTRDPVAPAQPSAAVKRKKAQRTTADGLPVHSFDTLLAALGTRCRTTCRMTADPAAPRIQQLTEPTPFHSRVRELLQL